MEEKERVAGEIEARIREIAFNILADAKRGIKPGSENAARVWLSRALAWAMRYRRAELEILIREYLYELDPYGGKETGLDCAFVQ